MRISEILSPSFINTSRGVIINERDLIDALKNRDIVRAESKLNQLL